MQSIESVVWPRGARTVTSRPLAQRLSSLEGKRIAFLWDYLFRGDEIWELLKAELSRRVPWLSFVDWDQFGSTHGEDEHAVLAALPNQLKALKVDAVVSGMGC